jgi:hypothetical protein
VRFFVANDDTGKIDLLWSMIYKDGEGGNLGANAEIKRREFLRRGCATMAALPWPGCGIPR